MNLPASLIKEIDKMIGNLGYRSRAEFVKDAVRKLLIEYGVQVSTEE